MKKKIAVIIPCYNVKKRILSVINKIDLKIINCIYIIDDFCPQHSGEFVNKSFKSKKIKVFNLKKNLGVGGATIFGFAQALKDNNEILIKIDGDGQHDPSQIIDFINPMISHDYNFCKGSRFHTITQLKKIPKMRLFGNFVLSFITKIITGFYNINDCVNGYIAIKSELFNKVRKMNINNRFFFEQDLLFYLSFHPTKIKEIPIKAKYFANSSNLNILMIIPSFIYYHFLNLLIKISHKFKLKKLN